MHPEAARTLDQVRQALDGRFGGEVLAGMIVGAASARTVRQVGLGAGSSPRLRGFLLLAATPTRLALFESKSDRTEKFVAPTRLVGDWALDLVTVDALPLRALGSRAPKMWAIRLTVPSEDLEIVLDCARVPAVDELLAAIVTSTGGTLTS